MQAIKTDLKAKDVMTADPVCVQPSASIRELARILEEHEISGVPVIDHRNLVVGVVSKTDLIRRCCEGTGDIPPSYLFEVLSDQEGGSSQGDVIPEPLVCVEDFMTEDPFMVGPEADLSDIARQMCERRIHRVIVASPDRYPLGVITTLDLLDALCRPGPEAPPGREVEPKQPRRR